jgi:hypothetical protein
MKASFQRVVGEINNPADGGVSDRMYRKGITCGDPFDKYLLAISSLKCFAL